jgi:hypothetical protein
MQIKQMPLVYVVFKVFVALQPLSILTPPPINYTSKQALRPGVEFYDFYFEDTDDICEELLGTSIVAFHKGRGGGSYGSWHILAGALYVTTC